MGPGTCIILRVCTLRITFHPRTSSWRKLFPYGSAWTAENGVLCTGSCFVWGRGEICSAGNIYIYIEDKILSSNLITDGRWIPIRSETIRNTWAMYTGGFCLVRRQRGWLTLSSLYKSNFPPLWIRISCVNLNMWIYSVICREESKLTVGNSYSEIIKCDGSWMY